MVRTWRRAALIAVLLVVAGVLVVAGLRTGSPAAPESARPVHIETSGPRLTIPVLGVTAPLTEKSSTVQWDPFLGEEVRSFGVPDDMTSVVRWSDGPGFGEPGMAVVLGHTQVGGPGVFNGLGAMPADARVDVIDAGRTYRYRVSGRVLRIPKRDPRALSLALEKAREHADLALVTCDGPFDRSAGASMENSIVFAEKIT